MKIIETAGILSDANFHIIFVYLWCKKSTSDRISSLYSWDYRRSYLADYIEILKDCAEQALAIFVDFVCKRLSNDKIFQFVNCFTLHISQICNVRFHVDRQYVS